MKKIICSILLISFTLSTIINAKDISGTLSSGDGSSFIPEQGSAFSIVLDIPSGFYRGKYDVLIRVNNNILYNQKDQSDDIYLVFNEPVNSDDIIKIDVTHGQFKFKMNGIEKLPKVIVDAIKAQLPQSDSSSRVSVEQDRKSIESSNDIAITNTKTQNKKSVGFLDALSTKLSSIFQPKESKKKEIDTTSSVPKIKKIDPKQIITPMQTPIDTKVKVPISKRGIDISTNSIDSIEEQKAPSSFSSSALSDIDKITTEKLNLPNMTQPAINADKTIVQSDIVKPMKMKNEIPSFKTDIDQVESRPTFNARENLDYKTDIKKETKPHFNSTRQNIPVKETNFQNNRPKFESRIKTQPNISEIEDRQIVKELQAEFDQSELAEIKDIEDISPIVFDLPKEPVIIEDREDRQRIVITKTLTPKQKAKKAKEQSRVIKRHITPTEYKQEQEIQKIPPRMADRIQGGGYMGISKGRVRVSAYSNNRPVSAWIEVFRAGTKQRVKTFYTGKGTNLRDIKLPAGVYVIKATYRTSGMKKQKTLARVVLEEGDSINKSITFDDGRVKINATKSGKPLYAKIEVFKKGTKRRIMYDFTSRRDGKITLSVPTGRYDIVVRDHSNVKRFDNVRIRAGKTRTFNADF